MSLFKRKTPRYANCPSRNVQVGDKVRFMGSTTERRVTELIRDGGDWVAELKYDGDDSERPVNVHLLETIKFKPEWCRLLLVQ